MLFTFAALVPVLLGGCAHRPREAARGIEDVTVVREDRQIALSPDHRCVELDNPFGDIHIRAGIPENLAYHAVIQRIEPRLPSPRVAVDTSASCIRISVHVDGQVSSFARPWNVRRGRLDLSVAIPQTLPVRAESVVGAIDAKKLDNPVQARTSDGSITLSGTGDFEATTVSGAITLTARGQRPDRRWRATSATGVVRAYVDAASAALSVRTCGNVQAHGIDALASSTVGSCARRVFGDVAAADRLTLESERGDIEIFRMDS